MLSVEGKVLGRIIIDRIRKGVDRLLRKEQAGYRKSRGTTDQVFILRNIIEQANEWQAALYLNFIDFENAFNSIHRKSLWEIMGRYGIPEEIVKMAKVFYNGFKYAVVDGGEIGEWFDIKLAPSRDAICLGSCF